MKRLQTWQVTEAAERLCAMRGQAPHDTVAINQFGAYEHAITRAEAEVRAWEQVARAVADTLEDAER